MVTSTPLLSFFNAKKTTQYYIITSIIAVYGLVIYELFPHILLDTSSLLYYFVIPSGVIASMLCLLPILTKPKTTNENEYVSNESAFTTESTELSHDIQTIQDNPIPETEIMPEQSTIPDQPIIPESVEIPQLATEPIDNSAIQDIIEKKIEPVGEEIYKIKGDTASLREDMSTIKTSIGDMFSKFEDAMIDLKSLQTEITNPLNFVQKNSESNEFKEVLAIQSTDHIGHLAIMPESNMSNDIKPKQKNSEISLPSQTENKLNIFKEMFDDKITLGKMMSIVSLVGDMMEKSGKNTVNILTDQCKIMGLNPDMEQTIHNVAKMLENSSISVNETLVLLYKFGQIVGINDKEANEYYVRLTSNAAKNSHKIPHEEYF